MKVPKISTAAARNFALSIGLASAVTCTAACHCNNRNSCDHFEKAKIETVCSENSKNNKQKPWRIILGIATGICAVPILYMVGYPIYYELKKNGSLPW